MNLFYMGGIFFYRKCGGFFVYYSVRYFVKINSKGVPVPNSLVYSDAMPKVGRWYELIKPCRNCDGFCIQMNKPQGYFQKVKYYYTTDEFCHPIAGSNISAYCKPSPGHFIEYFPTCLIKPCELEIKNYIITYNGCSTACVALYTTPSGGTSAILVPSGDTVIVCAQINSVKVTCPLEDFDIVEGGDNCIEPTTTTTSTSTSSTSTSTSSASSTTSSSTTTTRRPNTTTTSSTSTTSTTSSSSTTSSTTSSTSTSSTTSSTSTSSTSTTSTTTTTTVNSCLNVNGTFDSNLNGWDNGGGTPWVWSPNYGGCAQYVGVDDGGYIRQDILTIGSTYLITFDYIIINPDFDPVSINISAGSTRVGYGAVGTHSISVTLTCIDNTYFTIDGYIEGLPEVYVDNVCVVEVACSTYSLNNANVGMITVDYTDCSNSPATVDVYDSNVQICAKPGTVIPQSGLTVTLLTTLCQPTSKIYINNDSSFVNISETYVNWPIPLELDTPFGYPIYPGEYNITATHININNFGFRLLLVNNNTSVAARVTLIDSTGATFCQDVGFGGNMVFYPVNLQDSYTGNYNFTVIIEDGAC